MTRPASDVLADLAACAQRQAELTAELSRALCGALAAPPTPAAAEAPEYLTTADAAEALGVSVRTLEGLRASGGGPRFIRVGRAVRYARADLEKHCGSTTD